MILLDVNILLYSYNREVAEYDRCSEWLQSVLDQREILGIPWHCLMAFLRLTTVPRGLFRALSLTEAAEIIDGWIEHPQVVIPEPGRRFRRILEDAGQDSQTRGRDWSDAYLAALAIEQGASLATFDRDFRKFKNLKLIEL
ncbi:MAG: PIN domain-containing protein [Acidobacteria bacterium]|nr:PIN domain-containing protein [Acidobacteriota bacterium]